MSSPGPKQIVFVQLAALAKAMAHPGRLALLEQLAQGERRVEVLADRTRTSVANASQHLHLLQRAGLATTRRQGRFVFYALADDAVLDVLAAMRGVVEKTSAPVQQVVHGYFHERDALEPVSREQLLARLRTGTVAVLDVRPADEYALGHLPHALNLPVPELEKRLSELDPAQDIVAYCRGAYCVLSYDAVALLREHGFKVRRLQDGFPEWRAAGLPVAAGASP